MFPGALGLKTRQPLLLGRWRRYQPSGAPGGRGPRRPFGSSAATPPAGFGRGGGKALGARASYVRGSLRETLPPGARLRARGTLLRPGARLSRGPGKKAELWVPEGTLLVTSLELALVGTAAGSKELDPHTGPWMRKFPPSLPEAWACPTGCLDLHGNGGGAACGYASGFPRGI